MMRIQQLDFGVLRAMRQLTVCGVIATATALTAAQLTALESAPANGTFRVTLDPLVQAEAYSGRIYLALAPAEGDPPGRGQTPRERMNSWFGGPQILSMDIETALPGAPFAFGTDVQGYPRPYAEIEPGAYWVQAVAKRNIDSPNAGEGAGDLYSDVLRVEFAPGSDGVVDLMLSNQVVEEPFPETEAVRLVEMVSPSLSAFYGREIVMRAAVVLPEGWQDDPAANHPTLYFITGFGGNHHHALGLRRMFRGPVGDRLLLVVPDPTTPLGHSVFADSANTGPRGHALVHELIPEIEARFHGARSGERRFVTGISSGGWSSLWLQITYPDSFAACWSHCPDPVAFEDFQQINLYKPGSNMYYDELGGERPLARRGRQVIALYKDFVQREEVLGPGGQIHAFEAVFSPRGADGRPVRIFDRRTGAVDLEKVRPWEAYDIRRILERNWVVLGPKLSGKLHIYAGELDSFYLEGAVVLLGETLRELGSDAEVTVVPGMGHTNYRLGVRSMLDEIGRRIGPPPTDSDPGVR
ncbi:MAG: hypothetical protein KF866_07235 [Phycisphaeraceae bacterium]|nr:hypothetical protein [Phycisphaeraceae bacterium]